MANKRIRKKRAKAEMLRDKSKVIASMIAMFNANSPRYEQIKIAKLLWPMSIEELLRISDEAIKTWIGLHSPLRPMIPRNGFNTGELVNWHSTLSGF